MPIGILVISIIGSRILTTIFVAKIIEKALYRSLNHPEENFPIAPPLYNIVNISMIGISIVSLLVIILSKNIKIQ